ncbi:MAG: phosphate uptake regulator PhoU [Candidatus Saccharimonadales bacterium]
MAKRKLQATGGASLTLTLPKNWVNKWKLKSKDEVLVSVKGQSLIVLPTNHPTDSQDLEIDIRSYPDEWILREVIGAYISGADKITLHSNRITPSQNQAVRHGIQLLFGFEILEESSQRIVAQTVLDDAKFPVADKALLIMNIVRGMFVEALQAAHTGDIDLAQDIKQRDFEANKLLHAIKRQFQEILKGKLDGNLEDVGYYRSVAIQLERVGDHAVKIAGLASINQTDSVKLSTSIPAIQMSVEKLLKDVEVMLHRRDKLLAHRILDSDQEIESLFYSSKRMKQSYEGALIEDSLDRLRGYLMNIAELTIDYSFNRSL